MSISRRTFVTGAAAMGLGRAFPAIPLAGATSPAPGAELHAPDGTRPAPASPSASQPRPGGRGSLPGDRFDPWVEVDAEALRHNVEVVGRLTGGRPILAVVKNNAYGLGLTEVAGVLEPLPAVAGFAVVKVQAALALREAGVAKPVLHMGLSDEREAAEMVRRDIHLSLTTDDAVERVRRAEGAADRGARVHLYLDSGLSRMGIPWHRALPWMEEVIGAGLAVDGTFMAFTEDRAFDREQLQRFQGLLDRARERGVDPGRRHAASSNAVFHLPEAHLDMVRPGIALFGAYPSDWSAEREMAELRPAVRLRARVVRVEQLRPGDSVSYGRGYVAERPTWTATLPVGHTDGVPREAVEGARVLIGDRLYPVIGAVSASHSIVEVGDEPLVAIGDAATLVGPDHPDIHPNAVAAATGRSVYDVLMHLSPSLPRTVT